MIQLKKNGFRKEFLMKTFHQKTLSENSKPEPKKGIEKVEFNKILPLEKEWTGLMKVPLRVIRDYYGEKIALFFSFLNYYIYCSLVITIAAIPMFFLQRYFNNIIFSEDTVTDEEILYDNFISIATIVVYIIQWTQNVQ